MPGTTSAAPEGGRLFLQLLAMIGVLRRDFEAGVEPQAKRAGAATGTRLIRPSSEYRKRMSW